MGNISDDVKIALISAIVNIETAMLHTNRVVDKDELDILIKKITDSILN